MYFITICVQHRELLFGEIADGEMKLNQAGQMIEKWWHELSKKFPNVEIDEHIIMPNHFHGVIAIVGADLCVCPNELSEQTGIRNEEQGAHAGAPLQKPAVGDLVQWFKTMTTNEYIHGVKEHHWEPFQGKLWQRNYYEHVIRNESSLNSIRSYIQANPANWSQDSENPANVRQKV